MHIHFWAVDYFSLMGVKDPEGGSGESFILLHDHNFSKDEGFSYPMSSVNHHRRAVA